MNKSVLCYSVAAALLGPMVVHANCLIPSYTATYDLNAGGANCTLVQSLQVTSDHQYTLTNVTKAHVLFFSDTVTEQSKGLIRGKSIVPLHYNVVDTHKDQPFSVSFDWQQKSATTTYSNKTMTLRELAGDTEDNVSYQLAMKRDLADGYHKMFNFPVIALDANKQPIVKNIIYSAPHEVMLKTPLGDLKTYRVMTQDKTAGTVTTLWFAPKYDYAAVKSLTTKNGDTKATLILKAYQPGSACAISG